MPENNNNILDNVNNTEEEKKITPSDSNYEISLIDENLLRIKIITSRAVNLNCTIKNPSAAEDDINKNDILLHPKPDGSSQEIEIFISIGDCEKKIKSLKVEASPGVLTPNPEVAFLIEKSSEKENSIKTGDEILDEKLIKKNPYIIYRKLSLQNTIRGLIISILLAFTLVLTFYAMGSKKANEEDEISRMIILQDISDPEKKSKEQEKKEDDAPKINYSEEIKKKVNTSKLENPIKIEKRIEKPPVDTARINANRRRLDSLEIAYQDKKLRDDSLRILAEQYPDSVYKFSSGEKDSYASEQLNLTLDYKNDFERVPNDYMERELKTITLTAKKGDITFYIKSGKSEHYDLFRDKIRDDNKFNMLDEKYLAYKMDLSYDNIKKPNVDTKVFVYYIKFENLEFTCIAFIENQYFNDEFMKFLDTTVRSIRVSKGK